MVNVAESARQQDQRHSTVRFPCTAIACMLRLAHQKKAATPFRRSVAAVGSRN